MVGEFLLRIAVALPLVCAAAALTLWAVKRGWLRLPRAAFPAQPDAPPLDVRATRSLGPAARLAVVRFDGRDHLIGQSGAGMILIASTSPLPAEDAPCEP